jgi:hypothetical protein
MADKWYFELDLSPVTDGDELLLMAASVEEEEVMDDSDEKSKGCPSNSDFGLDQPLEPVSDNIN